MPTSKAATSRTKLKPAPKPASASKPKAKPAAVKKAAAPKPKPSAKPMPKPAVKKPVPVVKKPPASTPKAAVPAKLSPKTHAAAKVTAKPAAKTAPKPAAKAAPIPVPTVDPKAARKGITVVAPRPPISGKKPKVKLSPLPPGVGGLMDKLGHHRKPLIPSGPKAVATVPLGSHNTVAVETPKPTLKTPFNKAELDRFRAILLRKRAELVGDVSTMENEALKGESGSLSSLPQHIAEQGSEAYEQSLSLDLAAADRKLIKEIDDAIKRIDDGTFGVCERTGKPIKAERLEELPWARYSIEAARELERRSMRT